jgi:hypothetical protein
MSLSSQNNGARKMLSATSISLARVKNVSNKATFLDWFRVKISRHLQHGFTTFNFNKTLFTFS